MLLISIPVKDRLTLDAGGTPVRINGHATTLRRIGDYLHYQDEDGKENRCLILDAFDDEGQIHFSAASHGKEDSPHTIVRPVAESADATQMINQGNAIRESLGIPPLAENDKKWYWIAINGPSVALCPVPVSTILAHPTPQQLIGFASLEEAQQAQTFLLTAPINEVKAKMQEWAERINVKEMAYHRPASPQPPTHGPTEWSM